MKSELLLCLISAALIGACDSADRTRGSGNTANGGNGGVAATDTGTATGQTDSGVADSDSGTQNPQLDAGTTPMPDSGDQTPQVDAGTTTPSPDAGTPSSGLAILGNGSHSINSVNMTVIADTTVGHATPTDLAFHPTRTNELWVTNQGDNSMWIASAAGTPTQSAIWRQNRNGGGDHFYARPSSLAFGENGNFTTSQDEDSVTQPTTPSDFMGPTLWSSDMSIFDAGHGGHLDMLHNSPNGKGVAWERDNVYWYFDGMHGSITRYDFRNDHGPGGADHSDGVVSRFAEGQVQMDPTTPSHMDMDRTAGLIYVADTGNNRIAVLSVNSGTRGAALRPNYDSVDQHRMDGATISTFVDGSDAGLQKPVGLEIYNGIIFVSDNAQSRFYAFDSSGNVLDYLDTGLPPGSLMGLAFGPMGRLFFVDASSNRVLMISP